MLKNAFKISLNQPQKWKKPFKTYNNKLSMHLSKLPNKKSFLITWKKRLTINCKILLKLKQSKKICKINWKKHPNLRNNWVIFSKRSRIKLRTRSTKYSRKLRKLKTSVLLLRNLLLRLFKTRLTNLKGRHPFNLRKFLFLRISNKSTISLKNSLALCSQHLRN